MTRKRSPMDDPVVREVRAIRQRLWKEAGGTFEGLLKLLDRAVPVRPAKSGSRARKPRVPKK